MKKILIPNTKQYKANLHSHSVDSDGDLTAREMKELYKSHGYSILGFTDHAFMTDRSSLSDKDFIAISGYENHMEPPWIKPNPRSTKCYHLCFYSPDPKKTGMIGMTDYYYQWFCSYKNKPVNMDELIDGYFDEPNAGFGVENLNKLIKQAEKVGYLVVLNHPAWSHLGPSDYLGVKGLTAMEIFNYGSYVGGYEDECGAIYDQMLNDGQMIGCNANDDNHNNVYDDSFGGFNMMYPDEFTYEGVFNAIKEHKSYASSGAYINELTFEDGMINVKCENAQYIRYVSDRNSNIERMKDVPLTEATFKMSKDTQWFRIVVKDVNGKKAYTRGYFVNAEKLLDN